MTAELRNHVIEFLEKGFRFDGRKPLDYRKITVEYGISKSAEGSARVKIGETEVLAGVKMSVEKPYPDRPDEGTIMVNAELLPLSSPEFESGPPGIQAVELARVVDRGIRESKAIDFKKLLIKKAEEAWIVNIDIITINDAGNLLDAASLAALAAIKDTKMPKYKDGAVDYKEKTKSALPLEKEPIEVTVIKIGDHFIVDPLPEEEKVLDARLTVASTKDGRICALQKGGLSPLALEEIMKMINIALDKIKDIRKAVGG